MPLQLIIARCNHNNNNNYIYYSNNNNNNNNNTFAAFNAIKCAKNSSHLSQQTNNNKIHKLAHTRIVNNNKNNNNDNKISFDLNSHGKDHTEVSISANQR